MPSEFGVARSQGETRATLVVRIQASRPFANAILNQVSRDSRISTSVPVGRGRAKRAGA